jgi:hypothetical protein
MTGATHVHIATVPPPASEFVNIACGRPPNPELLLQVLAASTLACLPACLPAACSYVRVAPRMEQRQARMHAAYIYNLSPALLRADVAAFFDGYGLPEDEIRCVVVCVCAAGGCLCALMCCLDAHTHQRALPGMLDGRLWDRNAMHT